jgi:2-polyprenyl-6-methoxyphenol hydroxylase-like FAD-dependent oxidoreductase
MHVLIIGAGFGGLTLANGLRQHCPSTNLQIFDRHTSPTQELAGYGIHIGADGKFALKHCLPPAAFERFLSATTPAGTKWPFRDTQLQMLALRDDKVISGRREEEVERRAGHRGEFRDILLSGLKGGAGKEGLQVEWGKEFTHYEELDGGRRIRAVFADGSSADGDVLVGADGSKSRVRQQRLPELKREALGIVIICGRYQLDDTRTKNLPSLMTDGSLNNIVPYGKGWLFIASFPSVKGEQGPLENYTLWAYVVPKSQTPRDAKTLSPSQLRDIALAGVQGWAEPLATVIRDADLSTVTPIVLQSMPHLPHWESSNVILLGDAIHNMTPMAGVGANVALRDAHVLTNLLIDVYHGTKSIPEAVDVYERKMRVYANAAVALSRQIAEGASSESRVGRRMFHVVLRLAHWSRFVMRNTIGKGGFIE